MVIVISGAQATGKTTLAMALGRALGAPVFSRDPLMDVLFDSAPPLLRRRVPAAGYRLQTALLARQLELGQPAILECVAPPELRRRWRAMAAEAGHRYVSVECVCSDLAEHRARFERRRSTFRWGYVVAMMQRYRKDERVDYVADAMRPLADLVAEIVSDRSAQR